MKIRSTSTVPMGGQDWPLRSVQALRGSAALLVVIFHAGLRYDTTQQTFRIGNAGVDIFFVISGFVMVLVTSRRPTGPLTFLRQRCIRLVPLYWICTLVMVAAATLAPSAFPHTHLTASHVLLSLVFVPHTSPDVGEIMPLLAQGWTLNFEMFFYLLFAGSLLLSAPWRMAALVAAMVGLAMIGSIARTPAAPVTTFLDPLLIEFVGGMVLARLIGNGVKPPAMWCWGAVCLGVVLLAMAAPARTDDLARLLQYGVPAVLIVGGLIAAEVSGTSGGGFRAYGLVAWFGDASYSIYLTHAFAVAALGKLWPHSLPTWVFIVAATIFAMLTGSLVYALLERPLLMLMRRPAPARPAFPGDGRARLFQRAAGPTRQGP